MSFWWLFNYIVHSTCIIVLWYTTLSHVLWKYLPFLEVFYFRKFAQYTILTLMLIKHLPQQYVTTQIPRHFDCATVNHNTWTIQKQLNTTSCTKYNNLHSVAQTRYLQTAVQMCQVFHYVVSQQWSSINATISPLDMHYKQCTILVQIYL